MTDLLDNGIAFDAFGNVLGDDDDVDTELIEESFDEPDASLLDEKKRPAKAKSYEAKTKGLFSFAFKMTMSNEKTEADAAAILMYGPDISVAMGDLAAENTWVAKAVDMLTEGTDNAALALISATLPFALQVLRNHEPEVDVAPVTYRELRIPFRKTPIKVHFRIRLRRARQFTTDPESLKRHVFGNEKVKAAMGKQGMSRP